jgi:hypothetical protein
VKIVEEVGHIIQLFKDAKKITFSTANNLKKQLNQNYIKQTN